jgi:hypothetical protein
MACQLVQCLLMRMPEVLLPPTRVVLPTPTRVVLPLPTRVVLPLPTRFDVVCGVCCLRDAPSDSLGPGYSKAQCSGCCSVFELQGGKG